jgi:hypothetical protein
MWPQKQIDHVRVYPPIGIARVGNEPSEYWVGPEYPQAIPTPAGGYKTNGKVKRMVTFCDCWFFLTYPRGAGSAFLGLEATRRFAK